jgi:leader peptidase (prepilin peptidase)/N-methyltransferase
MVDDILLAFQYHPYIFYTLIATYSLMVGSFLNVVIYRVPKILEQEWSQTCRLYLASEPDLKRVEGDIMNEQVITLSQPCSSCPSCHHKIRFYENIPIISWIILRSKCSKCNSPISKRYPIVEGLTSLLSVLVSYHYGVSFETLFALILTWSLICLTLIDYDHMILPDQITLPLLWIGLFANLNGYFVSLDNAVIGAILGYGGLYSLSYIYKYLTGKEAMGHGDFKLVAMLGAWFGWTLLPMLLFIASLALTIIGSFMIFSKSHKADEATPFGPYLAVSGWFTLLFGESLWMRIFY